uniref:Uncharacterized protein n=1 Tax=Zooxanthella nutricula TaxID=1333877 RepID=A0A7S2NHT1_9DINO
MKIRLLGITMVLASALAGAICIKLPLQRRADANVKEPIRILVAKGPAPKTHVGQGSNITEAASNAKEHQWRMRLSSEFPYEAVNHMYPVRPITDDKDIPPTRKPAPVALMAKLSLYIERAPVSQAM